MSNVVVVGSSNTDMVLNVPDFPAAGQTIAGSDFCVTGGGKGANQVVAAAKAVGDSGKVSFIACVGDDNLGKQAVDSYRKCGVVIDHITVEKKIASGVALIFVADSGENLIGINPGANARLSKSHIDHSLQIIAEAQVLLTQLESPIETVLYSLKKAKEKKVKTILNPAPAYKLPDELFTYLDYITPNQTETEFYTGIHPEDEFSARKAAEIFHDKGVKKVIITMGAQGSFFSDHSDFKFVAARKVTAVDTVAAGDTFNGAFAACVAGGSSDLGRFEFCKCCCRYCGVTRRGAQESTPSLNEIQDFF